MYTLSLVVWVTIGVAPAIDTTKTYTTFEQCEVDRQHYNNIYETELQNANIAGYETSCKGTSHK